MCAEREREKEKGGGLLPVEIMLLISQWVLTQMEASKERRRVYYAFMDYSIYSLFVWLCCSYVRSVGHDAAEPGCYAVAKLLKKRKELFFFLNALKLLITYGLWLRLMAKPYRAGSDVRLIQHYARCACRCSRHGSFTPCIDANFRCLLRANTHSNFSEMKRWERQWWAACVPIFLHFSRFRTIWEVINAEWFRRMKPVQASSVGATLSYFQHTEFNLEVTVFQHCAGG